MEKRYFLSESDRRKLAELLGQRSSDPRRGRKEVRISNKSETFIHITGYTEIGSNSNRWIYTGQLGNWELDSNDLPAFVPSSAPLAEYIINQAEFYNQGSGIEGNGVNVDTLPDGFTLRPVPVGRICKVVKSLPRPDGNTAYVIDADNAIDGECQGANP